jgi:biopolymer transport protein ExbD
MSLRNSRKNRRAEVSLDITALIDVVFLLLIFFLVTSTFTKTEEANIPINLPSASTGQKSVDGQKVVLFITENGSVDLQSAKLEQKNALEGASLTEKLDALYAENPDANIVLKGDELATHGKVIEVLDEIKKSGFKKVNLVITRPETP